jgi:hypothetical protein
MHPTMIHKIELAVQKNMSLEAIDELIDQKLLSATSDRQWIFRSSVEALDRFLEAVKVFTASRESA